MLTEFVFRASTRVEVSILSHWGKHCTGVILPLAEHNW